MNGRATRIRNWVQNRARQMNGYWAVRTGDDDIQTLQALRTINSLASDLEMDLGSGDGYGWTLPGATGLGLIGRLV